MKSTATSFLVSTQRDALRFAEADENQDMRLTFEEFVEMQPARVRATHSPSTMKEWFEAADINQDGTVSVNEFFMWSMSKHTLQDKDSLQCVFQLYDKDATGYLDAIEFEKVCRDMGFGAVANEIFTELDADGTGYVQYFELLNRLQMQDLELKPSEASSSPQKEQEADADAPRSLKRAQTERMLRVAKSSSLPSSLQRAPTMVELLRSSSNSEVAQQSSDNAKDMDTKRFLMALAWCSHDEKLKEAGHAGSPYLDTSRWKIDAADAAGVARQLRKCLKANGASVADAVALFNMHAIGDPHDVRFFQVSESEFCHALRERIGYKGDVKVLHQVFAQVDVDSDGFIDCDELFTFVAGRRNALSIDAYADFRANRVALLNLYSLALPHSDTEAWSVDELREEMLVKLKEQHLSPADLMRAWDCDQSGRLSRREFLSKFKRLVVPIEEEKAVCERTTDEGVLAHAKRALQLPERGTALGLWDFCVRPAVTATFERLAGPDREKNIDIVGLSLWLRDEDINKMHAKVEKDAFGRPRLKMHAEVEKDEFGRPRLTRLQSKRAPVFALPKTEKVRATLAMPDAEPLPPTRRIVHPRGYFTSFVDRSLPAVKPFIWKEGPTTPLFTPLSALPPQTQSATSSPINPDSPHVIYGPPRRRIGRRSAYSEWPAPNPWNQYSSPAPRASNEQDSPGKSPSAVVVGETPAREAYLLSKVTYGQLLSESEKRELARAEIGSRVGSGHMLTSNELGLMRAGLDRVGLLETLFGECDDDGSGALSLDEFAQLFDGVDETTRSMFAEVDMEVSDGKLSMSEFVSYHLQKFSALDDSTFQTVVQQLIELAESREVIDDEPAVVP